jgi:predicted transcriptional regulator
MEATMPQRMSLDQLDKFLAGAHDKADAVSSELREVQLQFVSAHQVNQTMHDATLNDLSLRAAYDLNVLPADVHQAIDTRLIIERETLEKRRQELLSQVVPKAEQVADDLLARAQHETERIRSLNPRLNAEEEKRKADLAQMQAELDKLNAEIKRLSGCLTRFINYFKTSELGRKRDKLLCRMEENARALKDVREEWAKARSEYASEETQLQQQWQQANVDAARAREELAQLSDDDKREKLALQRAIFYVFDNWVTPLAAPGGNALVDEINQMVHYNLQQNAYEEGLGKVAGLIALLGGVKQGLHSIGQSVDALIKEQGMHSAYLKPVSVSVDDDVIQFHRMWDGLRAKVKDEKSLGQHPAEFSALFDQEVRGPLAEASIKRMFDSLSGALTAATKGWKG